MAKLRLEQTGIEGLLIIEPTVYGDARGSFMETYRYEEYFNIGVTKRFVQDNQSVSKKGVLRGLHFQKNHPQGKLVRVIKGTAYDVAVDLRKNSSTYGKWFGVYLSGDNHKQFYIPEGFAHGFLSLSDEVIFVYKCTDYYRPDDEGGVVWNDPDLAIDWPIHEVNEVIVSEKDKLLPKFRELG